MTTGVISFGFGNIQQLIAPPKDETRFSASYKLYGGEVELLFDQEAHHYFVRLASKNAEPVRCPGVTSITGTLDKPALAPWAAKMCAEAVISAVEAHSYQAGDRRRIHDCDYEDFVALVMEAKLEHRRISQEALDIGHIAHDWLEQLQKAAIKDKTTIQGVWESGLLPLPVVKPEIEHVDAHLASLRTTVAERHTEATQNCCNAAVDWMIRHNYRPIRVENKIYSKLYNYAGTFDAVALIDSCEDGDCCSVVRKNGRREQLKFQNWLVIADWKSSKGMYTEYRFQTSAYVIAWLEEHAHEAVAMVQDVVGNVEYTLPTTIDGRVVVKLGKDDGEFAAYILLNEDLDADFSAFLGLTTPYERIIEIEQAEKQARDLERSLQRADKAEAKQAEELRKVQARALRQAEREHKQRLESAEKEEKARVKAEAKALKEAEARAKAEAKAQKKKTKETIQ